MKSLFLTIVLSLLSGPFAGAETYDARIQEKEILTPLPAREPRINGPAVYGARPGKALVYRIPTQGERPIRFEATGLPKGLNQSGELCLHQG